MLDASCCSTLLLLVFISDPHLLTVLKGEVFGKHIDLPLILYVYQVF